jgi:hypothetical protein
MSKIKDRRPELTIDDEDLPPPRRVAPRLPEMPDDDAIVAARADALSSRHGALRGGGVHVARLYPEPSPTESWKLTLPDYLNGELNRLAAERKVTKNFLVIEALQKAGYAVKPEDLVGDRRRRPNR